MALAIATAAGRIWIVEPATVMRVTFRVMPSPEAWTINDEGQAAQRGQIGRVLKCAGTTKTMRNRVPYRQSWSGQLRAEPRNEGGLRHNCCCGGALKEGGGGIEADGGRHGDAEDIDDDSVYWYCCGAGEGESHGRRAKRNTDRNHDSKRNHDGRLGWWRRGRRGRRRGWRWERRWLGRW